MSHNMSHTVTVTRTTTTSSTSAIIVNTGYLKTWPGLLKLVQLALGIVVVGLLGYYINIYATYHSNVPELFYLLIATTFMIGTFLILLSCLISLSTGTIIQKTTYEYIYHAFAFVLYLIASITFLVEVNNYKNSSYNFVYEPYMAAGIIGLILSALYLLSTFFAHRSYRGL